MIAPSLIDEAVGLLNTDDFYRAAHGQIFDAIRDLCRVGEPVDILTVSEELEGRGALERVGGLVYLQIVQNSVPTAAHLEHYAKIVAERALRRRLIDAANRMMVWAYEETEAEARALVERAEGELLALSSNREGDGPVHIRPLLVEAMERATLAEENPGALQGLSSGIALLDERTNGWQEGDFVVVAGRPGTGKTALAMQFAATAGEAKRGAVILFSMEMSRKQVADRFLASEARVDSMKLRRGQFSEHGFAGAPDWTNMHRAVGKLGDRPLYVDDRPDLSPLQMRGVARRVAASAGGLAFVIVDYLQLMGSDSRPENRTQEVGQIARGLKRMARELGVPVMGLSQLNRDLEKRASRRPVLADLRESGDIEAAADLVLLLYRPNQNGSSDEEQPSGSCFLDPEAERAEIIIAKQRNGPIGVVHVQFQNRFVRYDAIDER